jgi:hypothetical protein
VANERGHLPCLVELEAAAAAARQVRLDLGGVYSWQHS